ncbi:MAG TPA: SRPBCC family protein [Acidimicrobiales bacterium]
MALQVIEHTVTTTAAPATVFALLTDGSTWPTWSPIDAFELLEQGDGSPEGLGALRRFTTGRHKSVERVVTIQPNEIFSYTLEKGMPLRGYQAVISLTPAGTGTTISWRSTFHAKFPPAGPIYAAALGKFIGQTVQGLGEAAAKAQVSDSIA